MLRNMHESQYFITHDGLNIQIELQNIVRPGDTRTKVMVTDENGTESRRELLVDRSVELLPVIQSMLRDLGVPVEIR